MHRVLVTGGAGFIGHHVVEHLLLHTDWQLVIVDRLDTSGNMNRLTDLDCWESERRRVRFCFHDLKAPINNVLANQIGRVDYIFHLAASTHVDRSIESPESFVLDNVLGTTHLLQFARRNMSKRFVYFSTDEVFGPAADGVAYDEWDRYASGNPYAASKAGGEEMSIAFSNTYRLPVFVTHTMNVIGERQHPEKFVPKCIRSILCDEIIQIHANRDLSKAGSRFYIHAANVTAAMMFLLDKSERLFDKFNIVGEVEIDNLTLANAIGEFIGKKPQAELVDFHSKRPGHDLRYALDGSKMRSLGWAPRVDFMRSLENTVRWYLEHLEWLDMPEIESFESECIGIM